MKDQNYKNHIRFYPPHHFVFYPVILALIIISIRYAFTNPEKRPEALGFAVVFILLGWLSFMVRQHYALTVQNRIVRLEMRCRYFELTQKRFELFEQEFSFAQIAALRFASDEELPALVDETLKMRLSPDEIKHSIRHWRPDHMRV